MDRLICLVGAGEDLAVQYGYGACAQDLHMVIMHRVEWRECGMSAWSV